MPKLLTSSRAGTSRIASTVFLCGLGFYGASASETSRTTEDRVPAFRGELNVHDSDSVLVEFPDWLTNVKSLHPGVVRVSAVRPNCLRVHSIASGKAVLHVIDRQDRHFSVEISVGASSDDGK